MRRNDLFCWLYFFRQIAKLIGTNTNVMCGELLAAVVEVRQKVEHEAVDLCWTHMYVSSSTHTGNVTVF